MNGMWKDNEQSKTNFFSFFLLIIGGCAESSDGTGAGGKQAQLEAEDEQPIKAETSGKVTYVVDGDTFDLTLENGEKERIRLTLVDTPETKHPRLGVQPFGLEASEFTKELLTGKEVKLEFDVQERDQYGRVLAYVWLDGKLVNEQLIQKGFARVAVYPPNTKYVDRFNELQREAQENKAGIWSIEDYVTDRGYQTEAAEVKETANEPEEEDGCNIKGNISSAGEKIYHMPGNQSYEVTKPEEVFCTAQEAEEAGFRAAKR